MNMKTIYLISTQMFKENLSVNDNVADYLINSAIRDAQTINLQQVCGTVLYRKILGLVENGTIADPSNEDYKLLLDEYIQPMVLTYAYVYALPNIRYKVMNVGVVNQSSDNSNPTDLKELQFIIDEAKNKAEYYATLLSDYLRANKDKYPELYGNKKFDEKRPTIHQYTSGLVLSDCYPDQLHYSTWPSYIL